MKIKNTAISLWLRQPSVNSNLHFEKNFKVENIFSGRTLSGASEQVWYERVWVSSLVLCACAGRDLPKYTKEGSLEEKPKEQDSIV